MKIVEIAENKNNIVKKHNDIIEAKGKLSETAQKMLAMLISMIKVDDSEFQDYALNIQDYLKNINSDSANVDFLKNKALELMKNPFYIINENGKKEYFNWCSKVAPYNIEGYIVFTIHNHLKPYLLDLRKHFTTYDVVNIMKLRGDYTLRFYEYLTMEWNEFKHNYKKRHNKTPSSYTTELEIDWFREFLNIPATYRYNNIKVQILEVAKKQFKEKTDIQFEYKEQKLGRKVDRLIITIRDNNKGSSDYLKNRRAYIAHTREKYKPDPANNKFPTILSTQQGNIKIDFNGKIYLAKIDGGIEDYTKEQADKLWDWLYEMAQAGNLPDI